MISTQTYNLNQLLRIVRKQKLKLEELDHVLVPFNVTKSHWFLLHVSMPSKTIFIIDSFGTTYWNLAQEMIKNFASFLDDYFLK